MRTVWKVAVICITLSISACNPPDIGPFFEEGIEQLGGQEAHSEVPELPPDLPVYMHEFNRPSSGSTIPGQPYTMQFSGHSFGGIVAFEVWVNDSLVGAVPPTGFGSGGSAFGHFFYGEYLWTPPALGAHTIAVRAQGTGIGNYSDFLEVEVTVIPLPARLQEIPQRADITLRPDCTPADLVPPILISPGPFVNVGTDPTIGSIPADLLQWSFPVDCVPDHFKIKFSPDRTFGMARSGMTDGYQTSWPISGDPPQMPLEPATQYSWTVRAWTDGVNGPDAPVRAFFTGPTCASASELVAPELLSPDDGAEVDDLYVMLHYQPSEPKCLPDGYFIDLQTDLNFSGTTLLGAFSVPGTYVLTDELDDCRMYYWRVAAMKGQTVGPYSETRSFLTDQAGTCMIPIGTSPFIEALKDQRCFQGPNPNKYPGLGYFLTGEVATIVAQDLRGEWWVIENPDGDDYCFVRKGDNQESGDTSDVPMWRDPEVVKEEEEEPLVCRSDLDAEQCAAAGGTWEKPPVGAAGTCKCNG